MSSESPKVTEGKTLFTVDEETFETYYKLVGDISSCPHGPVIALHGGPGTSHDGLIPLADLATQFPSTAVILYDQLGTVQGRLVLDIDLFIDELENILSFFNISNCYNVIGHSWGATLASEFVIRRQPKGLRRLVLQGSLASAKLRNEAVGNLRNQLPQDVQDTIRTHEHAGTTSTKEYRAAMMAFWERFACRIKPFPPEVMHSITRPEEDDTVLKAMRNGSAGLADRWDITDRIHLMRHVPTLLINGEYDFMTDEVCAPFFWGIDKVKWVRFANSSHMPHWEERERYMSIVGTYLTQAEV